MKRVQRAGTAIRQKPGSVARLTGTKSKGHASTERRRVSLATELVVALHKEALKELERY